MTRTTFAEYASQQDARNTIQLNVRKWTLMLCDALEDNFKSRNKGTIGGKYEAPVYKFVIEEGRKYYKIVMIVPNQNRPPSESVHAFVDKKLVICIKQHHSKHLQNMYVSTFASLVIVSGCWSTLTGQVVIST